MPSVPIDAPRRTPARVPLDRRITAAGASHDDAVAHSLDRSIEGENTLSKLSIKRAHKTFINEYSSLDLLRSCGSTYIRAARRWNRCECPLCPSCSRQRANRAAADLRERSADYGTTIAMTLSLSTSGMALSAAWDAQDLVRMKFIGSSWLRSHIDAWRWFSELTGTSNAWHPHSAFILFSRNILSPTELEQLREECISRWVTMATKHGYYADPFVQEFEQITRTPGRALSYASKGMMATHADSRTPGAIFNDAALRRDADAAADWLEIEHASAGRHWTAPGGSLRAARTQHESQR